MVRRRIVTAALLLALTGAFPASTALAASLHTDDPQKHHRCEAKDRPPECETPEAPNPVDLPLAGVMVAGTFVFLVRRQHILRDRDK